MAVLKTTHITIIVISFLHLISAQQVFQQSGDNYNARVSIHRSRDNLPAYAQPPAGPPQPWRQGDRITKQEIIQNLAKELLSHRKTSDERRHEKSQSNAENLDEYWAQKAKLAQKQSEMGLRANWNPRPQQPQPFNNQLPQQQFGANPHQPPRHPLSNNNNPAWTREYIPRVGQTRRFRKNILH